MADTASSKSMIPDGKVKSVDGTGTGVGVGIGSGLVQTGLGGRLLIALPHMDDPTFRNSVILLAEHSAEGAMGFMLTTVSESISFSDLIAQVDDVSDGAAGATRKAFDAKDAEKLNRFVRDGGPCSPHHGFIIHTLDATTAYEGTQAIDDQIGFTVSSDILRDIARGCGPEKYLISIGYAGWEAGQLEAELRENVWISCDLSHALIFDQAPEQLWDASFEQLGFDPNLLSLTVGRA